MKPYFDDGNGIVLYHGDCLEILSQVHGDVVVTSPPYNTLPLTHKPSGLHGERKTGTNKWIARAVKGYADNQPEEQYQEWLREIVGLCLRSVEGLVWVNHKVRYRDGEALHPVRFLPFPIYSEVIWNRRGSMALNCKRYAPSHEVFLGFGKPSYWDDCLNTKLSVWDIPFDMEPNDHPCSYPIALVMPLIQSSCPIDGIVLDPFAGSGTTLRAAKDLGRRAIGIEIEERYCEIAARRLEQQVLPFGEPSENHVDDKTTIIVE